MLNPVAPHITEELWELAGFEGYLYEQRWPEYDEEKTKEEEIEIAVQINGKVRAQIRIPADIDQAEAIAKAKEAVADKLTGEIRKEVYVPGRLVSLVVK